MEERRLAYIIRAMYDTIYRHSIWGKEFYVKCENYFLSSS